MMRMYSTTEERFAAAALAVLLALAPAAAPQARSAEAAGIVEYAIPSPGVPEGIALGPDGNYWFSERYTTQVGRVTAQGAFTIYSIPSTRHQSADITAGPDGALWFTFPNSAPP